MATFEDFQTFITRTGWIFGLAAAGSVFAPLLAAAADIAPVSPRNLPFVTAVLMLVAMLLSFALLGTISKRGLRRWLAGAGAVFFLSFGGYLYAFDVFVHDLPGAGGPVTVGCGVTTDALTFGKSRGIAPGAPDCPGRYVDLLPDAAFDPEAIWTEHSVRNSRFGLLAGWVASFASLAVLVTAFVLLLAPSRRRGSSASTPT